MKLFGVLLFCLILQSCLNKETQEVPYKTLVIVTNKDSLYQLQNGMQIYIRKNTFKEKTVHLDYIAIEDTEDFIINKVLTKTVDGKELKTYGMINVFFRGENGEKLNPRKDYSILSKKHFSKSVKLFSGTIGKDENVIWDEAKKSNLKLDFIAGRGSTYNGAIDLQVSNNVQLSDCLDSIFDNHRFSNRTKFLLCISKRNQKYDLDSVVWYTNKNLDLENEIKSTFSGIEIFDSKLDNYKNETNWSNMVETIDSEKPKTDYSGRSVISTMKTGWFNFDAYIDAPLAYLEVKAAAGIKLILMSDKLDRCATPNFYRNGCYHFEVPIEENQQKLLLFDVDDNRTIRNQKAIYLEIGKTTSV
jgi:hypothetical protein